MECLICSEPITHAHIGVNSCRACAVFYKRTVESKKKLKCKGGSGDCRKLNPKTTCRLCRFTRFSEILKKAVGESENRATLDVPMDSVSHDSDSTPFINHESFYDCEPSTSRTPLLDRIRKGYSLMCLIRHAGEIATRSKTDDQVEVRVRNMVFVPATYSTVLQHGKLCKEAMKAFANHVFDDFRELDEESKGFIINTSYQSMNSIDSAYRAMHNFPNEEDIRNPGYTTYMRMEGLERFFANCPDDIDTKTIVSELRKGLERSGRGVRRYFKRVNPTDYEFLALLGLSFWNDEISNLNEKVLQLAMKNRALIMKDLHEYYSQQGIRDYAVRIGNLYCILVNFQNNTARLQEDFQLYRLMNLFKDYFDKHCE